MKKYENWIKKYDKGLKRMKFEWKRINRDEKWMKKRTKNILKNGPIFNMFFSLIAFLQNTLLLSIPQNGMQQDTLLHFGAEFWMTKYQPLKNLSSVFRVYFWYVYGGTLEISSVFHPVIWQKILQFQSYRLILKQTYLDDTWAGTTKPLLQRSKLGRFSLSIVFTEV